MCVNDLLTESQSCMALTVPGHSWFDTENEGNETILDHVLVTHCVFCTTDRSYCHYPTCCVLRTAAMAATASASRFTNHIVENCKAAPFTASPSGQSLHADGPRTPDMQNGASCPRKSSLELLTAFRRISLDGTHENQLDEACSRGVAHSEACSSSCSVSSQGEADALDMLQPQPQLQQLSNAVVTEAIAPPVPARLSNPGEPLLQDNASRYSLSPIE